MSSERVSPAAGELDGLLAELDAAAYAVEGGWLPPAVRGSVDGRPQTIELRRDSVHFRSVGVFRGLPSAPHATVDLEFDLDLPAVVHDTPVAGEPLELIVNSLHPTAVWHDGRAVFRDHLPVVALGPAARTVVDHLRPGANGTLAVRMRTGRSEALGPLADAALTVHLTTPGIRARFALLDTVNAQLHLARALACGDADLVLVASAAARARRSLRLPIERLTAELADVAGELAPILERARDFHVWCIGHSHIDLAWMWDWADAREVVKRDLRAAVSLMDDYPEFRFTHSQPAGYQVVQDEDPQLFGRIRALIASGRWEPATMQWVEGDANIASGPATVRQLLEGVRYSQTQLGVRPHVHLAPDTFGHAGNLPQLASSAGATVYYHHRGNPGIRAGGAQWPAYWWEGDDGTRLLAISTPVYLGPLTAGRIVRDLITHGLDSGLRDVCYFYGVGDHGGGPTRQDLDTIRRLAGVPGLPTTTCATVGDFAAAVAGSGAALPVHRGESMTVFEGCYVSHADAKRANRRGETALVEADTLTALAGLDPPAAMREAWRTVLFNQFHDIAGGSAVRSVYEDQARAVEQVRTVAQSATDAALDRLEANVPAGHWAVTNPIGATVRTPVELDADPGTHAGVVVSADGHRYPAQRTSRGTTVFVADLRAFGTHDVTVQRGDPPPDRIRLGSTDSASYAGAHYLTIDTPHFYAQQRTDCGVITTLFDKSRQVELVGHASARARAAEQVRPDLGLGVLQLLEEYPHIMTSWVLDEVHREQSLIRGAATTVVESGPVRVVTRTVHRIRASVVTLRHVFYADLPRIDVDVAIDWQETGSPEDGVPTLAMSFTTRQDRPAVWYETPYSACTRPADGLLVPALRWADVGTDDGGLAVLNDGTYGHEALGSRLRIHLARGSYDPDPLGDVGSWTTRFSLVPHAGRWQDAGIVDQAAAFNAPPLTRMRTRPARGGPTPGWRPSLRGDPTVVLAEVKRAEAGDATVLRLYESGGRRATTRLGPLPGGAGVWVGTLVEEPVRAVPVVDGQVVLRLQPFEVVTLIVRH